MYGIYCILSTLSIITINQKENKGKNKKGVKISNTRVGLGGTRDLP
jgi:hypothetical protein